MPAKHDSFAKRRTVTKNKDGFNCQYIASTFPQSIWSIATVWLFLHDRAIKAQVGHQALYISKVYIWTAQVRKAVITDKIHTDDKKIHSAMKCMVYVKKIYVELYLELSLNGIEIEHRAWILHIITYFGQCGQQRDRDLKNIAQGRMDPRVECSHQSNCFEVCHKLIKNQL